MSSFPLRLPDDLKEVAARQAARSGISLNQYIAMAVAAQAGVRAEADRVFDARAGRAVPGRIKTILARAGTRKTPRPGDELD
jgi:hypothetical protein